MGFWLFSSNPCNCSSCELGTHPGAHRLVYVRRPSELNGFRNAMKTAGQSFHSGNHTRPPFPESAVYFQSGQFLERVTRVELKPGLKRGIMPLAKRQPGSTQAAGRHR